MEPDDPFDEEQDALGRDYPTPPGSEDGHEEPRNAEAEVENHPCRPGLQPKLNTVLCREASDVAPGIGTFARAESSLLFDTKYTWSLSEQEEDFDGSGPFLAARMQTCIANATGAHLQAFSDAIVNITGLDTTQPILKALPDAPRADRGITPQTLATWSSSRVEDATYIPTNASLMAQSSQLRMLCARRAVLCFALRQPCNSGPMLVVHVEHQA